MRTDGIRLAKKKLKMNRRRGESDDDSWAWMPTFGDRSRSSILRWGAVASIAIVLSVGAVIGFGRLRDLVHRDARYARPLSLEWLDLPPWMASPDNAHIVRALTAAARLSADDSMLDPKLSGRIGRALSEPAVGWIERVERVTVQTDGTVAVRCRFRRPVAWVLYQSRFYLVDDQAVRLPGAYEPAACQASNLLLVDGVRSDPPEVGRSWPGLDLQAGLNLVRLIADKPFRHQVERILVVNYGGRFDPHRPHIELVTDFQDARIWWGRAPYEERGLEIGASHKVASLEALYREWGRIDMRRSFVDITTSADQIEMPKLGRSRSGEGPLRG